MQFSFSILLFVLAALFVMPAQAAPAYTIQARDSNSGSGTYYNVGLGSCGYYNSDDEMVAALSHSRMGGPNSELCGKTITVNSASGSVTLKVVDSCPGCSDDDVDMSQAAFEQLSNVEKGRIPITWSF